MDTNTVLNLLLSESHENSLPIAAGYILQQESISMLNDALEIGNEVEENSFQGYEEQIQDYYENIVKNASSKYYEKHFRMKKSTMQVCT